MYFSFPGELAVAEADILIIAEDNPLDYPGLVGLAADDLRFWSTANVEESGRSG